MRDRELDAECARALGYKMVWFDRHTSFDGDWSQTGPHSTPEQCRHDAIAYWQGTSGSSVDLVDEFTPSTDPTAARLLEDEIERMGERAIAQYMAALWEQGRLSTHRHAAGERYEWVFIRATPEQRCRAFLKVVEDA